MNSSNSTISHPKSQLADAIGRHATPLLARLAQGFRVIALTGPRQSGKTTLAQLSFSGKPYVSFEDIDVRRRAEADPRGFLRLFPEGAIFDEVQRCPDIFSYLQTWVDARQRTGDFILTGSQQFGLSAQISQSLAGRAAMVDLLPLSLREIRQHQATSPSQATTGKNASTRHDLWHLLWRGGYPALHQSSNHLDPSDWYASYIATYVQRDVRQISGVQDLAAFERFVLLCAGRVGQLLNLASLAADCGVSANTAKHWVRVLEASYIIRLVQPWHERFGKRLVKMPKLYFLDTGLLCQLLRIRDPLALAQHALRGHIFESWVISETLKWRLNQGLSPDVYFWRDNHGTEIDLVFPHEELLYPVEIKSGQTFSADWFDACQKFAKYAGPRCGPPCIVYGGDESFEFLGGHVRSWMSLA
jgi:uncharacterized protein